LRILSIRQAPPGEGKTLARFDIELTPELRMYDLRLVQTESGRRLTYSQNAAGRRTATFIGALADEITQLASNAFDGGLNAIDHIRNQ
jgi:hypothetical protein